MVEENTHKNVYFDLLQDVHVKKIERGRRPAPPGLRARGILQFHMKASEFANKLSAMAFL